MKTKLFLIALLAVAAVAVLQTVGWLEADTALALAGPGLLPLFAGTTHKACEGLLRVEDPGMPGTFNSIGEVTSYGLEEAAEVKKYFKIGNCNQQSGVTGITRTMTFEGNYDPTDAGQPDLIKIGDTVDLEVYPRGNTTGKEKWTIEGVVTSASRTGPAEDVLGFSVGVDVNSFAESVVP